MTENAFRARISCDLETGQILAVYIRVRLGDVAETREIVPGNAIADYAANGELLGLELIGPCDIELLNALAEREPAAVKRFLHDSTPLGMIASATFA